MRGRGASRGYVACFEVNKPVWEDARGELRYMRDVFNKWRQDGIIYGVEFKWLI